MHFARRRLDRERRVGEEIVSAVHAALRRRFLVLLNCHMGALPAVPVWRGQNGGRLSPRLRHKGRMILCLPLSVKRSSKLFRALLHFLILLATAAPAFAQVYKWVDERGVTHYGERPPQGGKASEVPNRLASPAPGGVTGSQGNSASSPRQGEIPPRDPEPRHGTVQTEQTADRQTTRRQEQCNQQRDLLARLKQSPPSFTLNEKGERVQTDNSNTIARQEKLVAEQCRLASPAPGGVTGSQGNSASNLRQGEIPPRDPEPRPGTVQTEQTADRQTTRRQEQCNQQRDLLSRLKQNPQPDNSDAIARQERLVAEQCKG